MANPSHNNLINQSNYDKNAILGIIVITAGCDCDYPEESFFQGFDLVNTAYWNLLCEDGNSYRISIQNDDDGTLEVIPCEDLYSTEVPCFQKFN